MCNTGVNALGSLKKLAVLAENVIIFAKVFVQTEGVR
jgi:hypothetical protein